MRLLALDQAARVSGVSVFDNDRLIECATISVKSNQPLGKRMLDIWDSLNELYESYSFDKVAFEDIQLQMGNVSTFKSLAYVQAIIIFWCWRNDVPHVVLSPSHWRSEIKSKYGVAFGRKRTEQKAAALAFAKGMISKTDAEMADRLTEDMADSYCLGLAAIQESKQSEGAF